MTASRSRARRLGVSLMLLAASVALHAWFVAAVDGRLGLPAAPAPDPRPVEVALVAPPAPPPPLDPPPVAQAPRAAPPRPAVRPRPKPVAGPTAIAPPVDPAAPVEHTAATDAAAAADAIAADPGSIPAEPVAAAPAEPSVPADPMPAADPPVPAALPGPLLPALPAPRRQQFRVYWGDFSEGRSVARLEYRLDHDGERYEVRTAGEAEGLISLVYSGTLVQVSTGRLGPGGLQPTRYAEQRGRRPERSIAMDPSAHRLLPAGREPVEMPAGTQDRLSVFYQLGLLARAEPERFVAGAVREMPVASFREVRIERFIVVGDEFLMAPGGPIRALRLFRPPLPGTEDPRIDLWLGYDHDMLPVRLRIEDTGQRVLDQVLDRSG